MFIQSKKTLTDSNIVLYCICRLKLIKNCICSINLIENSFLGSNFRKLVFLGFRLSKNSIFLDKTFYKYYFCKVKRAKITFLYDKLNKISN